MNKKKVAVFVEGLTEQIFVRELLYVWFGYDTNRIGFHCYSLRADIIHDAPYNVGSLESEYFYQIITLRRILELKGIQYNKHESDISSLISKLSKTDYEILLTSEKCASFKKFMRFLLEDNMNQA